MRLTAKPLGHHPPHHRPRQVALVLFEGLRHDFAGGRQGKFARRRRPFRFQFRFDDALDFVAQALTLAFLLFLGGAKPRLFGTQLGHEVGARRAVLAQGVTLPGLTVQGGLHFAALLGQVDADFAEFGLGGFDLGDLLLADFGIGLKEAEAQRGLVEVLGRKHEQERVLAQLHAVGLLDHARVFVLEGGDMAFQGAQLRVGAAHGPLQGADAGFVVPHELFPELDLLVEQAHLRGRVGPVLAGFGQQVFCGFQLGGDAVALLLQGGLVLGAGLAPCEAREEPSSEEEDRFTTLCGAQNLRGC